MYRAAVQSFTIFFALLLVLAAPASATDTKVEGSNDLDNQDIADAIERTLLFDRAVPSNDIDVEVLGASPP